MEEKKKIKISLGMAILITIIILLVTTLGIVYYFGFVKNNTKKLEADNMELNKQIDSLKLENDSLRNKDSGKNANNNEDNYNYNKYLETRKYIEDGKITTINDETKLFTSENPKISFEFPRSWTISSTSDEYWIINIESPQKGVNLMIGKSKELSNGKELKDMLSLDFGSVVSDEGNIRISGYNGYYKKYFFGDGPDMMETKSIIIDLGNNQYYYIDYWATSGTYSNDYSKDELKKIYEEYEPIFEKIISSMKF